MRNWKILLTDGLEARGQEILRAAAQVDDRSGISAEELMQIITPYDALIVRGRTHLTKEVFLAAKRLKVVGRSGVGVDNIDLEAARANEVIVVNTPGATTMAVVELTLGLLFSLARSIPRANEAMKAGQWIKKDLIGVELNHKVLGVIGMGLIGATVAQRSAALGMQIIGYDPLIPGDEIQRRGAQPVSLDELYARADFITLHMPLTANTHHMLDEYAFNLMKPGVYILCTARGGIVDEVALLKALNSGHVAGAALDVFAQEPPGASALVLHPKVIATPHIGAQTAEAQMRAAEDIANEVLAALNGEKLRWKII